MAKAKPLHVERVPIGDLHEDPANARHDRKQSTIWDVNRPGAHSEDKTPHGTQKPVEVMARPIRNHGDAEDHVYDPFLGSGTTLIAAQRQLARRCVGLEISPAYCDVIVQRWENLTGEKAKREK